jgi:hypothetical protein
MIFVECRFDDSCHVENPCPVIVTPVFGSNPTVPVMVNGDENGWNPGISNVGMGSHTGCMNVIRPLFSQQALLKVAPPSGQYAWQ